MKRISILLFLIGAAILLGLGIAKVTDFSLALSVGISSVGCVLIFLMLDVRPEQSSKDTIYRLTRGSWYRKKK
ncbi:hypothetical protein [Acanthopleuribacter pedis]|uniref:Uncharacterized protein n=1 Tax=Acanthopleuribacter pedis TaxID=442870 RepID=A0A8J7U429_9BACT|nr:hypothetical protein [Acanthopleuribacter pedis]MBO1318943.1 hypothetical protein [Acanthopleuribacter pedis]